jgi:predicted NBD/HSP70 family sugar kinase
VHPDGKPCPCGSRGCLHTYASLEAILSDDPVPEGASPDATIAARAEAGRPATLVSLDLAGTALGVALSDMVNILDIDTVLLGGTFSLLSSWLIANARAEIDQRVLTAGWAPITIRPALLGPDAAVIGAALTSIDQIRQHPTAWLAQQP